MAETFKIRKGDEVIINTGKDKGRKGSVLNVNRKDRRVLVQGVNMVKRHTRPAQGSAGGIIEKEASVALSNVSIVDPKTGEASRVGYKTLDDGRKVRFAKKSGEVIDL
jgi:large subunit ribosomal protein L24